MKCNHDVIENRRAELSTTDPSCEWSSCGGSESKIRPDFPSINIGDNATSEPEKNKPSRSKKNVLAG